MASFYPRRRGKQRRTCLHCGHVGCDSSPGHATENFHATQYPVTTSKEPGEHWRWCYVDEEMG